MEGAAVDETGYLDAASGGKCRNKIRRITDVAHETECRVAFDRADDAGRVLPAAGKNECGLVRPVELPLQVLESGVQVVEPVDILPEADGRVLRGPAVSQEPGIVLGIVNA